MKPKLDPGISRRRFLVSTSMATTVALLAPRHIFAQDEGLVQTARKTAAAATVIVQKLRGNMSVLIGAGGNIRLKVRFVPPHIAGAGDGLTSKVGSYKSSS